MKLRETLNKNTNEFVAMVYEDGGEIIVNKYDNKNWMQLIENVKFKTIAEYEAYKKEQTWITKITKVSDFKKVA